MVTLRGMAEHRLEKNQTANVKGRVVAVRLRRMIFLTDHCMVEQIEPIWFLFVILQKDKKQVWYVAES